MARRTKVVMAYLGGRLLELSEINPTLSQAELARHFGVSEPFAAKVLSHPKLYRERPTTNERFQALVGRPVADCTLNAWEAYND